MSSVNKVIIIGRLGRDPEVRYMPNGNAVCNLSVATSERWTDKNTGEKKEASEWHRMVLFRRLGEVAGEYLRKGSLAYFEGRLKTRKWEKEGQTHYSTEIHVDVMNMLDSARGNAGGNAGGIDDAGDYGGFDDDIPFSRAVDGSLW